MIWCFLTETVEAVPVAAGMATSYNAPIAGAIFVMEIVLGNFAMDVFAPIVVASVLATIVRSELLTEARVYENVSDVVQRLPLGLVLVQGLLVVDHKPLTIDAKYIWVHGGAFEIGLEDQPFPEEVHRGGRGRVRSSLR